MEVSRGARDIFPVQRLLERRELVGMSLLSGARVSFDKVCCALAATS